MKKQTKTAYASAGVDIDEQTTGLKAIKTMIKATAVKGVLSNIGSFGGMFASPGKDHILVASADGVGTKLKVAVMARKHNTIGQDLINHCVNDILVQGAEPLFFLDYYGTSGLKSSVFKEVISGLCKACLENNCAMLGGETAEMPGLYPKGEYDLVGTIIGSVRKNKVITGKTIRPGDAIIGLASTGLHTNGYSLARKIVFEKARLKITDTFPGTKKTVADVLLAVHKSYLKPILELRKRVTIHGLAHITGGGFVDNIPRILPESTRAVIDASTWRPPAVFGFLKEKGRIRAEEMFRVFNMGIGMTVIVRPKDVDKAMAILKKKGAKPALIGAIEKGKKEAVVTNM